MKHFSFKALLCAAALIFTVLSAAPVAVSWEGGTGGALAAPKLTIGQETYNDHPVITCESIVDGEYQGILGTIAGKPDLSKYTGVRFFARCNFIDKGACVFRLNCRGTDGIVYWIYTEFTLTNQWTEVTIPFNPPFWKAAEGEAKFGIAESLSIYPYAAMNHKGCKLEVAGLQLIEPGSAAAPLTVQAYRYLNAPDTGDPQRKALTDGSMATQAYWRQYSDDAEIIFDLGSIYAVTDISVTANSIPAHNFSEMRITASVDGKDYYPVTILRNTRTDTKPVEHSIAFQGKSIGRFFRFRAVKPRPDFQIYIGEVKFSGYIPTVEEEKADAVNRYVIGPEMPARDSKAYVKAVLGDYTLWVNRENGVLNGVQFRDKLWIERLANRYVSQSRAEDKHFSAYDDKISDLKVTGRSVSFTAVNPGLPGITLSKCYELDATGALLETVRVNKTRALPREFLQISTDVILNQAFRENGVYESAGAGHTLSREFARDIRMETEACNFPVLSFENDTEDVTVFHSRIRANGKFIYNDAVVEEARLLMFLANGWRMPLLSCVPADADKMELSGTLRLSITDGGLLNAYDSYLSNPEVKEYLAPIRRPAWLRDQMMHGAPGWDGLCKGVSERYYENQNKLFDRGYYISAMREDLDFEWGAFRTEGIVEDWFGGQKTAQELEDLLAELRRIHPRLKVGLYTWLWTSFTYQDIVKKHPEWFVSENRSGTVACWFPGVNTNWLRLWTPESVDEAATSVMAMIKRYKSDNWYLDGGGAGSFSKDFKRMIIDDPHGATTLYQRIRKELQEYNPESFIHFNSPMNPLGDMGYLESFSGVMTREWRRGAAWMWKFKLFQYKDPLHTPLYIYWLPNVDGAFHNYMVGTALMPTALSRNVDQREITYISARYE
ncbi:MAG: discoidin domain-containing protein, partial [Victivallales bacterium]|nr:discoidin domain-containing protein [Victivallales bacterium]